MKTTEISIPTNRVVCIVCSKPLVKGGKYNDLNICVTDGSVVLTCSEHVQKGDVVVQAIQLYAKRI